MGLPILTIEEWLLEVSSIISIFLLFLIVQLFLWILSVRIPRRDPYHKINLYLLSLCPASLRNSCPIVSLTLPFPFGLPNWDLIQRIDFMYLFSFVTPLFLTQVLSEWRDQLQWNVLLPSTNYTHNELIVSLS